MGIEEAMELLQNLYNFAENGYNVALTEKELEALNIGIGSLKTLLDMKGEIEE